MSITSISSFSSVDFRQPEQKELSTTDWKTYAFVALSHFLIALGVGLAVASFYFAPILHPIILLSSSITFIVLGIWAHPRKTEIEDQPLGLKRKGFNCWMNASLQLISNTAAYQKLMENLPLKRYGKLQKLSSAYEQYQQELENPPSDRVSKVNTQELREWLSKATGTVSKDAWEQEDPKDFFAFFLRQTEHPLPTLTNKTSRDGRVYAVEKSNKKHYFTLLPHLKNTSEVDLKDLFHDFFNDNFGSSKVVRSYEKTPDDFLVHLYRFCENKKGKITKNQTKIQKALELSFSDKEFGEAAKYQCDGFLVHNGSFDQGHFITYVRKKGKWWEANDTNIRMMSNADAEKRLGNAYIIHYQKIKPNR